MPRKVEELEEEEEEEEQPLLFSSVFGSSSAAAGGGTQTAQEEAANRRAIQAALAEDAGEGGRGTRNESVLKCRVCGGEGHSAGFVGAVYMDCPNYACYLCKQLGHTTATCPYRAPPQTAWNKERLMSVKLRRAAQGGSALPASGNVAASLSGTQVPSQSQFDGSQQRAPSAWAGDTAWRHGIRGRVVHQITSSPFRLLRVRQLYAGTELMPGCMAQRYLERLTNPLHAAEMCMLWDARAAEAGVEGSGASSPAAASPYIADYPRTLSAYTQLGGEVQGMAASPWRVVAALLGLHTRRVSVLSFHPTDVTLHDRVVSGDKSGNIGVWKCLSMPDYDSSAYTAEAAAQLTGYDVPGSQRTLYSGHKWLINALDWSIPGRDSNPNALYTASYDGTVRYQDLERQTWDELVDVNPNGWTGDEKSCRTFYSLSAGGGSQVGYSGPVLAGDDIGRVWALDRRQRDPVIGYIQAQRRGCKVQSIHHNPRDPNIIVTAGNDWCAHVFDLRALGAGVSWRRQPDEYIRASGSGSGSGSGQLPQDYGSSAAGIVAEARAVAQDYDAVPPPPAATEAGGKAGRGRSAGAGYAAQPLLTYQHPRVVNAAYFSPHTGSKLLTTCIDNRLRVWNHWYTDMVSWQAEDCPKAPKAARVRQPKRLPVGSPTAPPPPPSSAGAAGDDASSAGGVSAASLLAPDVEVVHSHDFTRYLSPFRAVWDPKDVSESTAVCGRYISEAFTVGAAHDAGAADGGAAAASSSTARVPGGREPAATAWARHPVDVLDVSVQRTAEGAHASRLLAQLVDPVLSTIAPVTAVHPTRNVIVSGSSRALYMWAPLRSVVRGANERVAFPRTDALSGAHRLTLRHRGLGLGSLPTSVSVAQNEGGGGGRAVHEEAAFSCAGGAPVNPHVLLLQGPDPSRDTPSVHTLQLEPVSGKERDMAARLNAAVGGDDSDGEGGGGGGGGKRGGGKKKATLAAAAAGAGDMQAQEGGSAAAAAATIGRKRRAPAAAGSGDVSAAVKRARTTSAKLAKAMGSAASASASSTAPVTSIGGGSADAGVTLAPSAVAASSKYFASPRVTSADSATDAGGTSAATLTTSAARSRRGRAAREAVQTSDEEDEVQVVEPTPAARGKPAKPAGDAARPTAWRGGRTTRGARAVESDDSDEDEEETEETEVSDEDDEADEAYEDDEDDSDDVGGSRSRATGRRGPPTRGATSASPAAAAASLRSRIARARGAK